MKKIETVSVINAPSEHVWKALVDFKNYKKWNSFIPCAEGNANIGSQLKITITPPAKKPITFNAIIIQSQENKLLQWQGSLLSPILFKGIHTFELERLSNKKTRLIHYEVFSGILVPVVFFKMAKETEQGFKMMNDALNEYVSTI